MSKFTKIFLITVSALVLIFSGIYIYVFYAGGIESIVTSKLDDAVSDKYNLDITIGDISGDLMSGIVLTDVVIAYVDSVSRVTLLEIPRLEAHYALSGILSGDFDFSFIQIDSAKIYAVEKPEGGWHLPPLAPGGYSTGEGESEGEGISFNVDNLQINNATVTIAKLSDTILLTELNMAASLQAQHQTFSADLERLSAKSNRENLQLQHCSGKVTFARQVITFQDFNIGRNDSRIKLNGHYDLKEFLAKLNIAADNLDINEISKYAGLDLKGRIDINGDIEINRDGLTGSIDLGGQFEILEFKNLHADLRLIDNKLHLDTVYGTILDNCAIDGMGIIDFNGGTEKYELRSRITGFNLNSMIHDSFESDLTGDIYIQGSSFSSKTLAMNIDASFYESSFNDFHLHYAVGSMQITPDSIVFFEPFVIEYFENIFGLSGKIDFENNLDIEIAAQLNNLERYQGKLFIDKPAGRGYAEARLTGKTSEPDLEVHFESDSVWIYDLFSRNLTADTKIKKFLTSKKGKVEINMYSGTAWDIPVDSGHAVLEIDSNIVSFDSLLMQNEFTSLYTVGSLDYESNPMQLGIDTIHLSLFGQEFFNRGAIAIGIDSTGFDFQKAALGHRDVLLSALGSVGFDESMDMRLDLENVIISPWTKLFGKELEFDGQVSGRAELHGLLRSPSFSLALQIDSMIYRNVILGDLNTNISYNDQLLTIDSLVLLSNEGRYTSTGTIPIDLSLTSTTVRRLLDRPMDLAITAKDKRFDLVTTLLPSVEQLDGDFLADFRIFGSPDDPHIEGNAHIKNARMKYFDLEQYIYSDSASVTMNDNRILIDNVEAYTYRDEKKNTPKRIARLEGEIVVRALDNLYYDVYVTLPREFPFAYELADIRGAIEGEMHVEGETPPTVSGDLTLVSMKYEVNFASPDEGSPIMSAFSEESSWNLNLNNDILSNFWVKNDDIDAQFTGYINIIRNEGRSSFIGELEVVRGRGYLFDKIFTLEPGGTVTFEGGDSLNPRLDLVGSTRITVYLPEEPGGDGGPRTEQRLLELRISGTLDYPEINQTENSEVADNEFLPLLTGTSFGGESGETYGSFENRLSNIVATQMSQIGSRQLRQLGVETFEVNPVYYQGQLDLSRTRFTLGFSPLDPNLYVYGRSALTSTSNQEIGFEYRFNKRVLLEGRRDEEELYHLNLKLHWEY